ncbi:MAG: C2H2-type zinc finger protein [Nitrososphaerales archaeon]
MPRLTMPDNTSSSASNASLFGCKICKIDFPTKLGLAGHRAGKHRSHRCSICKENFGKGGDLGRHKIEAHGYTRKQLGWGLTGGWNKGMTQLEAFNVTGKVPHGNAEFMNRLNTPEYLKIKKLTRRYHEDMVLKKELELRVQGYRTFCTSNYTRHNRIPDIIAISPDGKVVAIEMESIRRYKSSVESLRKKYTILLMKEGFFDDVVVEGFTVPKFVAQGSNTLADETG